MRGKDIYINENKARIDAIIESLLKTARLDFTSKMELSEHGDELDAIAIGLNTVSEELEAHIRIVKEAENRFRNMIDNAPEAVIVIDEESRIKEWNPKAELIFNWQKDEVIGKLLYETIIPPEYHEAHINGLKRYLQTSNGPILNKLIELPALRKGNIQFDAGLSISPFDYGGKKFFIGFISDITERKKADEKIKKINSELEERVEERTAELLKTIKEISDYKYALDESSIVAITDQKGIIRHVNDNFCKISKYTEKELLGQDHRIINSGYHPKEFIRNLWVTIANGTIWKGELKNKAKDGTHYWVDTTIVPFLNELNKPYQYLAIRSDITSRKEAEENLEKTLKEISDYKYALDESSIVAITDQKGIIRYANHNFCKISKYSYEELIGQDHRIINSGYHPKDFIRNLWMTIANGKIWRGELKNKAKDGTFYWVDTTIIPFLNKLGKPYQYVAIRADITQRKQAEEEILILNEELENRVKERTEELESFTYSVSHDLRSPLRAVNGYARILEEDYQSLFDNEGKRLLGEVQANAAKMGALIDDLLSFSRLGKQEINRSFINMADLTRTAIQEVNHADSLKTEMRLGKLLPLQADYSLMLQVMINLLSNAIKYSSQNEKPVVEITSKAGDNEIIYTICDNGVGFDMEYAHKLFGVFQRLHSAEEFSGTGVGLAIVKRIITKHHGKIWAEGKVNKGATFHFSLPDKN